MTCSHKTVKHTSYSLAIAEELFGCVWPLCGIKSQRVKSQNHFDIFVKPTWRIYLLQSLQGYYCDCQFLFLIWMNLVNQSFTDQEVVFPIFSVQENLVILSDGKLYELPFMQIKDDDVSFLGKSSFMIQGAIPVYVLNILIANLWRLFWWIGT